MNKQIGLTPRGELVAYLQLNIPQTLKIVKNTP